MYTEDFLNHGYTVEQNTKTWREDLVKLKTSLRENTSLFDNLQQKYPHDANVQMIVLGINAMISAIENRISDIIIKNM